MAGAAQLCYHGFPECLTVDRPSQLLGMGLGRLDAAYSAELDLLETNVQLGTTCCC